MIIIAAGEKKNKNQKDWILYSQQLKIFSPVHFRPTDKGFKIHQTSMFYMALETTGKNLL